MACAKAQCERDHGRGTEVTDDLAGCQGTAVENGVFALLRAPVTRFCNKHVLSMYYMHGTGSALPTQHEQTDTTPAVSELSF